MGVDYTANYGIGIMLETVEDIDMCEYAEELIEGKVLDFEIDFFEVGQGDYTGEDNDYYIYIKDAMSQGLGELGRRIRTLESYLKEKSVKCIGDFDVVGGLNIH